MKCPYCNEKIEKAVVSSFIYQTVYFDERGIIDPDTYKTIGYGDIESISCPHCDQEISSIIFEHY